MKNISCKVGSFENFDSTPLKSFDSDVCDFLSELSLRISKSKSARLYPDLASIAFYCRKANIQKLKENFGDKRLKVGRGLCFHVTPSNIPTNFAYSYIFSILAGNSNIVRLSSKEFPQVDEFCSIINSILPTYPKIQSRTVFVKYSRDDEDYSLKFSLMADTRMLWGGDLTIKKFKTYETKSKCLDITFPDRYSLAIIDGKSLLSSTDEEKEKLASNFYNDTFLVDQNACSSPQLILWTNDCEEARKDFWSYVYSYAKRKYALQDAISVDKYTLLCKESIDNKNLKSFSHMDNLIYLEELKSLDLDLEKHRGMAGYFCEFSLNELKDILPIINDKFQTLTYFGIEPKQIGNLLLNNHSVGIDRIVPIGKALDINSIWDGFDLVNSLSRIIDIQ